MSSSARILSKMQKAEVPPHAYDKSLAQLGQHRAAAMVSERSYKLADGAVASYLVTPSKRKGAPNPAMVCSVIAKEMVLAGATVWYLPLLSFLKASQGESLYEYFEPGAYIIIGDIGGSAVDSMSTGDWANLQAEMLRHVSRGGGLILGISIVGMGLGWFNDDMSNAFEAFDSLEVE